jgi:hypothetical protein
MEIEGRGDATATDAGGRAGPSAAVAELTAAADPEPDKPQPTTAHTPWVRNIKDYERRETTVVEGLRYG